MRISDWSSDVCSYDLARRVAERLLRLVRPCAERADHGELGIAARRAPAPGAASRTIRIAQNACRPAGGRSSMQPWPRRAPDASAPYSGTGGAPVSAVHHRQPSLFADRAESAGSELRGNRAEPRSEEHTSELQSLMRISYAVFCLKKKKK